MITRYLSWEERYPDAHLTDSDWASGTKIELTEEEFKDYEEVRKRYSDWLQNLKIIEIETKRKNDNA